jgi:hypothetical protein
VVTASATDANGYPYVAGITAATDFPTSSGAYRRTPSKITTCEFVGMAHCDYMTMFVAKLKRDGTGLVYSTFIGVGYPVSIAVDNAGNAYVLLHDTGIKQDMDIPTTSGAWRTSCGESTYDTCYLLIKLNATGSALVYSTFLEASNCDENFNGVALDSTNHAFVVGTGGPGCFMTSGAFRTTTRSYMDAVAMKFNIAGSDVLYSTYVGGSYSGEQDHGTAIAVDSNDHAIITGDTSSPYFPTSKSAFQRVLKGGTDAFVAKLSADGSALLASTLLGGSIDVQGNSGFTYGTSVAVDPLNNVYVAGHTTAMDFPVTSGAPEPVQDPSLCDFGGNFDSACGDDFLTKLPMSFSAPVYSTFLGGPNGEEGGGLMASMGKKATHASP